MKNLDIRNNKEIFILMAYGNGITKIDLSTNINLEYCSLDNNKIESIIIESTKLKELYISNNNLTNINLTKLTSLLGLTIYSNPISKLDISKNTQLKFLITDADIICVSNIQDALSKEYKTENVMMGMGNGGTVAGFKKRPNAQWSICQ